MRTLLKALANGLAWLLAAPLAYPVRWSAPIDRDDAIFATGSQLMSLLPGLPGAYLRRAYYRVTLHLNSQGFVVGFGTLLNQRGIYIGHHVYIGTHCNIGLSMIDDDTLLGSGVHIISGTQVHHFDRTDIPIREQGGTLEKIRIGKDCWLGNQATVMANVGDGAIIGAGALVNKPIEPLTIAVGNPAKPIRTRADNL